MKAEILCVGTELLLGDIVNTNAAYLARELARLGVEVYHQSVVGDNPARLKEEFKRALAKSDFVLTTGGLGPTYDDLTKETAAELFGVPMEQNDEALADIESFFQRIGRTMTANNKKQAMMPRGAIVLKNEHGTAPGVILEDAAAGKAIALLPGPPREMAPMFQSGVAPYIQRRTQQTLRSRTVHIFGMGESQVEEILRSRMQQWQNPTVAPYAKDGEVLLRVTARAADEDACHRMMEPVIQEIVDTLGDVVYGVDVGSLQNALVQALIQKGLHIATAESCTGGLVSKRITEVPGASQAFGWGVCCYANEVKERLLGVRGETLAAHGAVSPQTAQEMAKGIRRLSGTDIGVAVTGIAGPDGGTAEKPVGLVYLAVDSANHSEVVETRLSRGYPGERELIRYLASSRALHLALKAARAFPG
jgi:nicotinamide-nucleotide amidase